MGYFLFFALFCWFIPKINWGALSCLDYWCLWAVVSFCVFEDWLREAGYEASRADQFNYLPGTHWPSDSRLCLLTHLGPACGWMKETHVDRPNNQISEPMTSWCLKHTRLLYASRTVHGWFPPSGVCPSHASQEAQVGSRWDEPMGSTQQWHTCIRTRAWRHAHTCISNVTINMAFMLEKTFLGRILDLSPTQWDEFTTAFKS